MSGLLNKNQVVLGRDYLKQYKIKVDRGNDTLEIDGVHVQINACKVEHDAVNQTQQQSNVIMPKNPCRVAAKRILGPNSHSNSRNLVKVFSPFCRNRF